MWWMFAGCEGGKAPEDSGSIAQDSAAGVDDPNVAACDAWWASTECHDELGVFAAEDRPLPCEDYEGSTCDLGEYFACLTENAYCESTLGSGTFTYDASACVAPECG